MSNDHDYDGLSIFIAIPIMALVFGLLFLVGGPAVVGTLLGLGIFIVPAGVLLVGLAVGSFLDRGVLIGTISLLVVAVLLAPFGGFMVGIVLLIFPGIYGFIVVLGRLHTDTEARAHDDPFDYVGPPELPPQLPQPPQQPERPQKRHKRFDIHGNPLD